MQEALTPSRLAIALLSGALLVAALLLGASRPDPAAAASCSINTIDDNSTPGYLLLEGAGLCSDHSERFRVFCSAGTVNVDYAFIDTNDLSGVLDTTIPCGSVQAMSVSGLVGGDLIDVSAVAPAPGGFGSLSHSLSGGVGGDTFLLRNNVPDSTDCGDDTDSAQADRVGVDSLANCEIVSFLPEPVMATAASAVTTPVKKCKRKHRSAAAAKKRCKKKR